MCTYVKMYIRTIFHRIEFPIVFLFLISLALCGYIYINLQTETPSTAPIIQSAQEPLAYTCCTPLNITMRKNMLFIKIHKTGSTTIQNIIYRFAQRYTLDIFLPIYYLYYYHTPSNPIIWSNTEPPNKKYHISPNHIRYGSELKLFLHPDTVSVTLLRHPISLFRSIYEYFGMRLFNGMTLQTFLNATIKPKLWGIYSEYVYKGYNQMSIELGFDEKDVSNKTAIAQFIGKIDNEFDFFLITEYMDASLVLLANLMGWPLEYVLYLKANARPPNPNAYILTEQDKATILELNHVDALLYHHFMQKFRKCVKQYGEDKLRRQVLKFQLMNKQFEERCVASNDNTGIGGTINYKPKDPNDWECVQAMKLQNIYEMELIQEQRARLAKFPTKQFGMGI